MTEVIIALALVVIVTGAAISVLVSSVRFHEKYNDQTYALNACESAISCMRFAEDTDDLFVYLYRLGFVKTDAHRYVLSESDVSVEVVINGNVWTVSFNNELI